MEIVHAHTTGKLNVATMDCQQKIKVNNPLQHKEPSLPKRLVVKYLNCGKVVSYQKSL
jgi:hypothetical protein